MAGEELVFLPLGGSGEIGMNMNLYGFGRPKARQWIMIDCGVTFGDLSTPGVDLICPDPAYILEHRDKLLALVLTHGHEDHIGAVALLAPDLKCPVYATPFTAALVRRKLEEQGASIDLRVIDMSARFDLGPFNVEFVTLTHSIPEPSGIIIRTAFGTVLHTGDWKIDPEPTLGPVTDDAVLRKIGDDGVLAMVCDSTNVFSRGESGSEMRVKESLTKLISAQKGRVAVTTFASNVSRVVSICEAAAAADRSVCLLGRSMLRIVDAAREVGILPGNLSFVSPEDAGHLPREHVLYLCTGSQGEPRAALARIAEDGHPNIVLEKGDCVVFSSRVIPGNEVSIFDLQNTLALRGIRVITEKDHFVHVSGHPCRDELARMYQWIRPEISVPVHGEARHLAEHAALARELQVPQQVVIRNGLMVRLAPGPAEIIDEAPSGRIYLDGDVLTASDEGAVQERRRLAFAGSAFVSVVLDGKGQLRGDPQVRLMGLPEDDGNGTDFEDIALDAIDTAFDRLPAKRRGDDDTVAEFLRRAVRGALRREWGKKPQVAVVVTRI